MSIASKLKHAVMDEDGEEKKIPAAQPVVTPRPVADVKPVAGPPTSVHEDMNQATDTHGLYDKLKDKTDLEQTQAWKTIHEYMTPLENMGMDEHTLFKVALAQAAAKEHLVPDTLLATIDKLKQTLQDEQQKFEVSAQNFEQKEVSAKQMKLDSVTKEIADTQKRLEELMTQQSQASTDITDAKNTVQRKRNEFATAVSRRSIEIDQLKAKYTTLLKG